MKILFWIAWTMDLLLAIFVIAGAVFRGSLNLSNPLTSFHCWAVLISLIALIGGLLLRFNFQMPNLGLCLVALPLLAGIIYYIADTN